MTRAEEVRIPVLRLFVLSYAAVVAAAVVAMVMNVSGWAALAGAWFAAPLLGLALCWIVYRISRRQSAANAVARTRARESDGAWAMFRQAGVGAPRE